MPPLPQTQRQSPVPLTTALYHMITPRHDLHSHTRGRVEHFPFLLRGRLLRCPVGEGTKSDGLSWIPRTHMVEDSTSAHKLSSRTYTHRKMVFETFLVCLFKSQEQCPCSQVAQQGCRCPKCGRAKKDRHLKTTKNTHTEHYRNPQQHREGNMGAGRNRKSGQAVLPSCM